MSAAEPAANPAPWRGRLARTIPWIITVVCFGVLYRKIAGAAPNGDAAAYLATIFAAVDWLAWLSWMIPYSIFFLLIDTLVLWRVVNWFNAPVTYPSLLPIRASSYIISLIDERIGKGAIAWFLKRREGVPGWQVASSMLFIMFCEFFYLLSWALAGVLTNWERVPADFHVIPWIALGAAIVFALFVVCFRSDALGRPGFRDRQIFHAFRSAPASRYLTIIALRSPALLAAVFVYSRAASLFGVEISLGDMLGILPVIFFGAIIPGPFRAVAVSMWTFLFPDQIGPMTAFGFVMHNFFVLFNAAIGAIFLPMANRELARV